MNVFEILCGPSQTFTALRGLHPDWFSMEVLNTSSFLWTGKTVHTSGLWTIFFL
jgi:hypothetical protein